MLLGSYYSKCLLNEIKNKPYSKTKVLITDIIQKIIIVLLVTISLISLTSCTENQKARAFGGTETIQLEQGVRLVNVTWKGKEGSDLWILTKKDTTAPTTYYFKEKSNFGVMEGEVIIIEK